MPAPQGLASLSLAASSFKCFVWLRVAASFRNHAAAAPGFVGEFLCYLICSIHQSTVDIGYIIGCEATLHLTNPQGPDAMGEKSSRKSNLKMRNLLELFDRKLGRIFFLLNRGPRYPICLCTLPCGPDISLISRRASAHWGLTKKGAQNQPHPSMYASSANKYLCQVFA